MAPESIAKEQLAALLRPYQERIERELRHIIACPELAALRGPIAYFFTLPAKRVRPLITLLTAEHFFNDYEDAVPPAVAIEVLHHFTLVHDDIMDDDHFRRGCETIHNKWDIGTALLSGDAMIAMAYGKLLTAKSPHLISMLEAFNNVMHVMCDGQARDKDFETRAHVSLDDYLSMIHKKTARLISLAFELGYLTCSSEAAVLRALRDMGKHIGLAFQVRDDLLDFMGEERTLGKDVGSDWRQRKKTYMTIGYHHKAEAHSQLPKDLFEVKDFAAAKAAVVQAGIADEAQQFVDHHLHEAESIASILNFSHPVLHYLFRFLAERDY